jgi:hypothetical protein
MLDLVVATAVKSAPAIAVGALGDEGAGVTPGKYKTISAVMKDLASFHARSL